MCIINWKLIDNKTRIVWFVSIVYLTGVLKHKENQTFTLILEVWSSILFSDAGVLEHNIVLTDFYIFKGGKHRSYKPICRTRHTSSANRVYDVILYCYFTAPKVYSALILCIYCMHSTYNIQ